MSKPVIPLIAKREQLILGSDTERLRRLIKSQGWTFDHTLQVFSSVVFYSGKSRRKRAVAWLEELIRDLMSTSGGEDDTCWKE